MDEPAAADDLILRYAERDTDVVAIHGFLCITMAPLLPGPIDPRDSATEVFRLCREDVAIMAIRGDKLVGTLGLIRPTYWWNNKVAFLANRWFAALPGSKSVLPMMREARAIAKASELELHIYDEQRGRLQILNKSKNRTSSHVLRRHQEHDGQQ